VAAFAARLKDVVDLDSVTGDLARVAEKALEPAHVSIWINDAGNAGSGTGLPGSACYLTSEVPDQGFY
jgi:hypothetical protein